ncbi:hypothetical protein [Paenibacillus herberti]|uniref:hypothetical protein n=1 Tax=Paenibacillus herberti TaxID=1619309 RepID=UPI001595F1B7|nr:hypothetical protein [Paenibacillus herberti]
MKNVIRMMSPLLLVSYLLLSHFELPVPDFVKGTMLGLIVVGSCYTVAQFGLNKKVKTI